MRTISRGVAILLAAACAARADLIQELSNPQTGMAVDGSRADWSGVTSYPDDSIDEPGIGAFDVDWARITLAHQFSTSELMIRYEQNRGADFGLFPAFYNLYLDTDLDRTSGYIGGGGQFSVGADFLLQGASLFAFTGAGQTDFSWSYVGAASFDNSFSSLDLEMGLALSLLNNPVHVDFLLLADNELNGNTNDYYEDTANQATGGFFRYTIPEPGTGGAMILGALLVGAWRCRRRVR
jgi:hypothetical protein